MSDLGNANWSETDASNNAATPDGWPEGQNPSTVNNCARMMMGATKRFWDRTNSVKTTAGSSTVYTLTYDVAALALYDGEEFSFIVDETCGAAPTLNINGLGAKNLRKFSSGAWVNLGAGDIVALQPVRVRYNLGATTFDIVAQPVGDYLTSASTSLVPVGAKFSYAGRVAPSGFLLCNGAAVLRATYPGLLAVLIRTSVVTMTIATPCVVSWTAHGMNNGDPVKFSTSGALPTGLTAGTTYFVVSAAADTFRVALTPGGAAINTTGSQSGVQTAVSAPDGDGDGTTTFNVPDHRGYVSVGHDTMGASAASRVTFAGSGIYGSGQGQVGGDQTHTLTTAESPAHTHALHADAGGVPGSSGLPLLGNGSNPLDVSPLVSSGGGGAHNNMQPSRIDNWIIKT